METTFFSFFLFLAELRGRRLWRFLHRTAPKLRKRLLLRFFCMAALRGRRAYHPYAFGTSAGLEQENTFCVFFFLLAELRGWRFCRFFVWQNCGGGVLRKVARLSSL